MNKDDDMFEPMEKKYVKQCPLCNEKRLSYWPIVEGESLICDSCQEQKRKFNNERKLCYCGKRGDIKDFTNWYCFQHYQELIRVIGD